MNSFEYKDSSIVYMWLYIGAFVLGFATRQWLDQPIRLEDTLAQTEAVVKKNEYLLEWIRQQKELRAQKNVKSQEFL